MAKPLQRGEFDLGVAADRFRPGRAEFAAKVAIAGFRMLVGAAARTDGEILPYVAGIISKQPVEVQLASAPGRAIDRSARRYASANTNP